MAALRRGGQALRLSGRALLALRMPVGPRRAAAAGSVGGGAVVTPGVPPPPTPVRALEDIEDHKTAMLRKLYKGLGHKNCWMPGAWVLFPSSLPLSRIGRGHRQGQPDLCLLLYENPDYHGFDDDPVVDLWSMRIIFFLTISVCVVMGFTLMHYMPDNGLQEWARREAERLVRQREAQGLPVLDPNYYDPKTLVFPPLDED